MKDVMSDPLKFASLVAHQLRGPVSTVGTILQTLLGEFAGPLTPRQKDLLQRAIERCDESLKAAQRLLVISKAISDPGTFSGMVELSLLVRKTSAAWIQYARPHNITLTAKIDAEPAWAFGTEAAITEVLEALLSNAVKYTPDNGRIADRGIQRPADGRGIRARMASRVWSVACACGMPAISPRASWMIPSSLTNPARPASASRE